MKKSIVVIVLIIAETSFLLWSYFKFEIENPYLMLASIMVYLVLLGLTVWFFVLERKPNPAEINECKES